MKQLSIIIPAYNVSPYIERCLDSVTEDTDLLKVLDVIVINDGSTDDTLEKIKRYEKMFPDSLRVIDKENGGHGSGINRGVQEAKGKYLKVLDGIRALSILIFFKELKNVRIGSASSPAYLTIFTIFGISKMPLS